MQKYLDDIKSPADLKKYGLSQLPHVCEEVRKRIIEVVSKTGGHLASSLGAVELAVALHYVFNSPEDKFVWDVGHQAYAHKILTGRSKEFETLRKMGGISGFLKREESPHDVFGAGHASTSLSAALGFAVARDRDKKNHHVICIAGDAALTGGMAFEALNNAAQVTKRFILIINDNEMSISKNVGAISKYLNKIITSPAYNRVKRDFEDLIKKIPSIGTNVLKSFRKLEESVKSILVPGVIFEELGFNYYGPIDGHDVVNIVKTLENVRKIDDQPIILHVLTKKGKGYKYAEECPEGYHGIKPFDIQCGLNDAKCEHQTYSEIFGKTIIEAAEKDKSIIAITAAMESGTELKGFREKYPDRFFDVGIAEEHAVTFAAGLAAGGYKPVVAIYSTFLQRSYDQIVHDVALQNLPVMFCIDRAGVVGEDGQTHHGVFDISFLRHIPNMILCQPADAHSFSQMIYLGLSHNGPFAVRYPRGFASNDILSKEPVRIGRAVVLKTGKDGLILAVGEEVRTALKAANIFQKETGKSLTVIDARFIKPLDDNLAEIIKRHKKIMTLEDSALAGGFSSAVMELIISKDIRDVSVIPIGYPDQFIEQGTIKELKKKYGLDEQSVLKRLATVFG
jgi:1-deoxy-D-xylulose-5-phosphate synthase